jgi:peptidylprolyl isomerase
MKLNWWQRLVRTGILAILLVTFSLGLSGAWFDRGNTQTARESTLAQGDAITDPQAILRYALPIDNDTIREIQKNIEEIEKNVRRKLWPRVSRNVKSAAFLLNLHSDDILASVPAENQPRAKELVSELPAKINNLQKSVEAKDKELIGLQREKLLQAITELEELMVAGYPFQVPSEYANLPQLLGRATVEVETTKGNLTIVVDGYSAPVNGGNFVDLVQRGFYDGLPLTRAEDYYVIQTGDPLGPEEGFIDPDTGEYRAIPLEVLVKGHPEPIYRMTTEDAGLYLAQLVLPFNAYGAVALARPDIDPNGGSSQFFFFKFDTEVTPPGFNLMDGRYSVFGYVTDGADVLEKLTADDRIISAKVVAGLDNLVEPKQLSKAKPLPEVVTETETEPKTLEASP